MKKYQLMAPGPTPVPPTVLLAMARPIIHHRAAEYDALFSEVREGLKRLVQTRQDVLVPACTGHGRHGGGRGQHAVGRRPGDRGQCRRLRAALARDLQGLRSPASSSWRRLTARPWRPTGSRRPCGRTRTSRPCWSSTASRRPACSTTSRAYAQVTRGTGAILIVDAVSSLGIADLPMDAWEIDVVVSASQKGLMLPPGLGLLALSEKAWAAAARSTLPKYYLDLTEERKYSSRNEARFTPAVSIMVGLREVLRMIEAEGLAQRPAPSRPALARDARGRRGARPHALSQDDGEPGAHGGAGAGGSRRRPGGGALRRLAQHHDRRRPRPDEGQDLPHRPHGLRGRLRRHLGAGRARAGAPRAGASGRLRRVARRCPEGFRRAGVAAVR